MVDPSGSALARERGNIPSLDGLRAIAAIMVMSLHFFGGEGLPQVVRKLAILGGTGVDLFFVLSGFLITRILLGTVDSPSYFRTFFARRVLRIFPLYYFYLLLYFFAVPLLLNEPIPPFRTQIWSWLYLENVAMTFPGLSTSGPAHFWSLSVEEHFYLGWPIAVFLFHRMGMRAMLAFVVLGPLFLRVLFVAQGIGVGYFTLTRLDAIGMGAILAAATREGLDAPSRGGLIKGLRLFLFVVPVVLMAGFVLLGGQRLGWVQVGKLSLIPAVYFALMGLCILDPAWEKVRAVLSARSLGWIGKISYGLYVYHVTCFHIVDRAFPSAGVATDFLASFGLTFGVAALSFKYFERPLLDLKGRFPYAERRGAAYPVAGKRLPAAKTNAR